MNELTFIIPEIIRKPAAKFGDNPSGYFLVTLFKVGFFMRSLPYGSLFRPICNLGSLLGLITSQYLARLLS